MGFPSMPPFGAFPPFGLPASNFSALNSFASSTTTGFPSPTLPSLLPNDPTNSLASNVWSNGLSTPNTNIDYNEYAKQLGILMNAFNEQAPQKVEIDKSKSKRFDLMQTFVIKLIFFFLASPTIKSSKSKRRTPINSTPPSSSSDIVNDKTSTSKIIDESHPRPTSTSSSTSSRRSSSNHANKSSTSSSSRSKPTQNSNLPSSSKTPTNNDSSMLDPLAFAAAAAASGGLQYPYFLPSLLSQASGTNNNYPFSTLSSSLMNPSATLYPFLSPDWFTSSSKFMDGYTGLTSDKSSSNFPFILFLNISFLS